jgi:cytochrome c551
VPAPTSAAEPKPDIAATPTPTAAPVISEPAKTSATPAASEPAKAVNASAQAEVLYKSSCVSCHGVELEGKSGPSLQQVGTRKTKEQIMTQINKGSSKMPGFENRLDQASVELLAVWLADKK